MFEYVACVKKIMRDNRLMFILFKVDDVGWCLSIFSLSFLLKIAHFGEDCPKSIAHYKKSGLRLDTNPQSCLHEKPEKISTNFYYTNQQTCNGRLIRQHIVS